LESTDPVVEEILHGGIANAGAVVRRGNEVVRPAPPNAATIHALLAHLRTTGFDGVPEPRALTDDGRERLTFIPGDVPQPPFPAWSQTDEILASTTRLIRRFHDATATFDPPPDSDWNGELADPSGEGEVICHNDVCPENVVFRDGEAVALLDLDFAAPGRRIFDVARFARMWIPLDTPEDAARTNRAGLDPFARLRVVADAYGLADDRADLVHVIEEQMERGSDFVRRRVEAGHEAFTKMWNDMGGEDRYRRRRAWFAERRQRFLHALTGG
jgi:hypothetical protein